MIEITYYPDEYKLAVSGHSGYAEKGKDIVCAGVSSLFYALAASLDALDKSAWKTDLEIWFDDGEGTIKVVPDEKFAPNVQLIFWTILNGLEFIASSYPDHVKFSVKNFSGGLETGEASSVN